MASRTSPAVSVIIPTFNRAQLIGEAMASVIAQTFTDFELIVIDDCSTDNSAAVIADFADPRVRPIALQRNGGSNAARNAGINAARAPVLCFLDSDDLYLPGKLEFVAHAFADDPKLDVLVDSSLRMTSPRAKARLMENRNRVTHSTADFALALFRKYLFKATSAISVRREAAVRAGLFAEDIRQRQDFDFLIRLTETAHCASTDEILWIKRWTHDRITNRERFVEATIELVRRHPQYLTNRHYRGGLARDIVRNSRLLWREGKTGAVGADLERAARAFGLATTAGLVISGIAQIVVKGAKRQPRSTKSVSVLSPEVEAALAAARSRGSRRS